jgi:hypothetical protein
MSVSASAAGSAVAPVAACIEPRVLRLWKVQESVGQALEVYHLEKSESSFEYLKVISPEDGTGIRVRVQQDWTGFLGARTAFGQDLTVAVAFGMMTTLTLALVRLAAGLRRRRRGAEEDKPADNDAERANALVDSFLLPGEEQLRLRRSAAGKVAEVKRLLTRLGLNVRDLVREARDITTAAAESQKSLSSLRSRVHVGIRELHDTRLALKEVGDSAVQAEITALNLVVEASQKENDARRLAEMAETLHQIASRMRDLNQRSEAALGRIELQIEPMSVDADRAHHSFDDLFRHTREMDAHIRQTTETLIGQARMVQNLSAELGAGGDEVVSDRRSQPRRAIG